jgi:hypothetical protein
MSGKVSLLHRYWAEIFTRHQKRGKALTSRAEKKAFCWEPYLTNPLKAAMILDPLRKRTIQKEWERERETII